MGQRDPLDRTSRVSLMTSFVLSWLFVSIAGGRREQSMDPCMCAAGRDEG